MHKLSYHLHIRLNEREQGQLETLAERLGADRSTLLRLALKRLIRKPPMRRFRFRLRRGAKP